MAYPCPVRPRKRPLEQNSSLYAVKHTVKFVRFNRRILVPQNVLFLHNERYQQIYQVFTNRSPDFSRRAFSTVCLELAATNSNLLSDWNALNWVKQFSLISHTRTVVLECRKGDDASQWGNGKFDPLSRPNPLTDRHKKLRDFVPEIYPHAKCSHDPLRGFFSPYARNCASKMFTRLLFGSLQRSTAKIPNRLSRVIRQTTRFRARMCHFGVRNKYLTFKPYKSQ